MYTYDRYDRLTSVERYKTDVTELYYYEELEEDYDTLEEFVEASLVRKQSDNDGAYECTYEDGRLVSEKQPNAPGVAYT